MSQYISEKLRKSVEKRAENICEYCLICIDDTYFGGEIDHIISVKHSGETMLDNLALACQPCNRSKGSDIGSILSNKRDFIRFFNPRTDKWSENFQLFGATIQPISDIGKVTTQILGFNEAERIRERFGLIEIEHYPSKSALKRMQRK
jgi:hypothetical protein